jgi:hypothetical protein
LLRSRDQRDGKNRQRDDAIEVECVANRPSSFDAAQQRKRLERVTGIEPAFSAWEADVLPLNYTRRGTVRNVARNPVRQAPSGARHRIYRFGAVEASAAEER